MPSTPRPPIPGILWVMLVIIALQLFNLLTHDDVLTAVVTIVVGGTYVAWYFWKNRYH